MRSVFLIGHVVIRPMDRTDAGINAEVWDLWKAGVDCEDVPVSIIIDTTDRAALLEYAQLAADEEFKEAILAFGSQQSGAALFRENVIRVVGDPLRILFRFSPGWQITKEVIRKWPEPKNWSVTVEEYTKNQARRLLAESRQLRQEFLG